MVISEILDFIRGIPPFQFLDEPELKAVAGSVSMEFYPKNMMILWQDGPPSEFLNIIKKGGVKIFLRAQNDEEIIVDYRGEGDSFGILSLIGSDRSRLNVLAVEDTICCLVPREMIRRLIDENPVFAEFFLKAFFTKFVDNTYRELHRKSMVYGSGDRLLFSTPVGELARRAVLSADQDIPIRDAARLMSDHGVSSLVLTDGAGGSASGIITDRDLRDKVVAPGRDVSEPIRNIMSMGLIKTHARDYCFEALLKMIRHNIHHLLVMDNGQLVGIITNHDIMMMQGTSPISVTREIDSCRSIGDLAQAAQKIYGIIGLLLKEGARAGNITRIITEINDRVLRRILAFAESRLGPPPAAYCWIVYGSDGRREQTFRTDQDNAIIYDDVTEAREETAGRYFHAMASFVIDALSRCGFPACPAGYMATNPLWCRPLRSWKRAFLGWVNEPMPDSLLKALVFSDLRPVGGETGLAESLRDTLLTAASNNRIFLGFLANSIIRNAPPTGFLKAFVVEKSGEHKDQLNLKVKGSAPFVDIVRLFSLERGIRETSTVGRLHALREVHTLAQEYAEEIEHAFEFVMLLRIHHQFGQIEEGRTPDNFVNPHDLSNLERRSLREAFSLTGRIHDVIIERYRPYIW